MFTHGVARTDVAIDDEDYERNLRLLAESVVQFELQVHAWCFLPNHTHLLVSSPLGNLSDWMRWYGTCAAQSASAPATDASATSRRDGSGRGSSTMSLGSSSWCGTWCSIPCVRASAYRPVPGSGRALQPPPACSRSLRTSSRTTSARHSGRRRGTSTGWSAGSSATPSTRTACVGVRRLRRCSRTDRSRRWRKAHHAHGYSMADIALHLDVSRATVILPAGTHGVRPRRRARDVVSARSIGVHVRGQTPIAQTRL